MISISRYIAIQLGCPIGPIRGGDTTLAAAGVPVPEAAMDEDDCVPRRKDHIGLARQSLDVEAIAVSQRMDYFPHREFRLSVFAPNAAHILGAAFWIEPIHLILAFRRLTGWHPCYLFAMGDTGLSKLGFRKGLDKEHRDYELVTRLENALIRHAKGWDNFVVDIPNLLRQSIDEVIDAPRSRRFLLSELEKTEKTYIGTKIEILLRNHLNLDRGEILDVRIDGIEVGVVYKADRNWIIPRKAIGHPCILIETNEENTHCSLGLIVVRKNSSTMSDIAKREFVVAHETKDIHWMLKEKAYPKPLQELVLPQILEAVNASKGGTERLATLFRLLERTPVSRDIIFAVAPQMDGMRCLRKGGGARDRLAREGIFLLSGRYQAPLIERRGLPRCTPNEFISVKPARLEDRALIERMG